MVYGGAVEPVELGADPWFNEVWLHLAVHLPFHSP